MIILTSAAILQVVIQLIVYYSVIVMQLIFDFPITNLFLIVNFFLVISIIIPRVTFIFHPPYLSVLTPIKRIAFWVVFLILLFLSKLFSSSKLLTNPSAITPAIVILVLFPLFQVTAFSAILQFLSFLLKEILATPEFLARVCILQLILLHLLKVFVLFSQLKDCVVVFLYSKVFS